MDFSISNQSEYIKLSVKLASKLSDLWKVNDFSVKKDVQNFLFPEGIYYDKEIEGFRTKRVNSVIKTMTSFQVVQTQIKKDKTYLM